MIDFIANHWVILDVLLVAIGLVIYVTASKSLHQRRHPSAAFAWVMGILLFPFLTVPLYLVFGTRKIAAHRIPERMPKPISFRANNTTASRTKQLGRALGLPSPVSYQNLYIHEDGTCALHALREIIQQAEHTLEICTFLMGRDALGDEITEMLAHKAQSGIKVRFLIDGVGIYMGGYPDLGKMIKVGVEVTRFSPPFRSHRRGRTNLRNHRKMVIADKKRLWCGGRNLAAEYFEGDPRKLLRCAQWLDLSFDASGELVLQALRQFDIDWTFALEQDYGYAALSDSPTQSTGPLAQIIDSGPDRPDDTILTLLISACFTSQKRILAVTPYFVPDASLLGALMLAARRGINIDLVLPEKSNHWLVDFVRHRALRDLVEAGGRVWLHPRMIHAKAVLIDDDLAMVGSANLDGRSLFMNYEMMVAFYEPSTVKCFAKWIEQRRHECFPYVVRRPGLVRDVSEGVVLWLGFQL